MSAAAAALPRNVFAADQKPNVLFIPVDDLRPQLGCYGKTNIHSPHIDRLASEGVLFERTYCNVPVCGASRASLLTGVRPTPTRFVGYNTRAKEDLPGALTLPKHFKDNGYHTISNGKVFHHDDDMIESWSEKPWRPTSIENRNWRNYITPENLKISAETDNGRGPAYEHPDIDDNAYFDGMMTEKSLNDIRRLAKEDKPFFIATGFLKPHLPFNAPKKYWDLYDRDALDMADNPYRPLNAPDAALHNFGELRQYYGIPQKGPLSDDMARTLVHGYYACVSYTDALIGKLLNELDALGIRDNTIVILWGDHGWNLREHGLWCKHCNFETSLHAPMLVSAPGFQPGLRTSALTEYVDIFPSLCELAGLDTPSHKHGKSFVPLMRQPDLPWKDAVYSRFHAGDSVRTDRYLYTEWTRNGSMYARMLYDHKTDPDENVNIAGRPENQALVRRLAKKLDEGRQLAQQI
ncbi:sulfatase [bacterium]|nr:sulfatase [bacterium]